MRKYCELYSKAGKVLAFAVVSLALQACTATTGTSSRIQLGATVMPPLGLMVFCADSRSGCEPVPELAGDGNSASTGGQGDGQTGVRSEGLNEAQVEASDQAVRVEVSSDMLPELTRVNRAINGRLVWQADLDVYGVEERWAMPLSRDQGVVGDCEEFALEKRQLLLELGVPAGALALAVTRSRSTGRHTVLVVRTTDGDYVLDNATPWVLPWAATGYQWLNIQDGESLMHWRSVASGVQSEVI